VVSQCKAGFWLRAKETACCECLSRSFLSLQEYKEGTIIRGVARNLLRGTKEGVWGPGAKPPEAGDTF